MKRECFAGDDQRAMATLTGPPDVVQVIPYHDDHIHVRIAPKVPLSAIECQGDQRPRRVFGQAGPRTTASFARDRTWLTLARADVEASPH